MKQVNLCILMLAVLLLGTQRTSEAFYLKYLSGGITTGTWVDESSHQQSDPTDALASTQISGIGSATASAHAGAAGSGYNVAFSTQVNSFIDDYWTSAQGHTTGANGFILFEVSASPEDLGNSLQVAYEYDYSKHSFFSSVWDPYYVPLVITVNGVTKVNDSSFYNNSPAKASGFLDVNDGNIIGLSCGLLADDVCYAGNMRAGFMDAMLNVSVSPVSSVDPVPLPSTFLLLGSGLFGLAAYGRRKQASKV